jgi:hypothetical protein
MVQTWTPTFVIDFVLVFWEYALISSHVFGVEACLDSECDNGRLSPQVSHLVLKGIGGHVGAIEAIDLCGGPSESVRFRSSGFGEGSGSVEGSREE